MIKKGNKKVGFFGGTFDPIHLGHLNLALELLEIHSLTQIFFCPTSQSPHKMKKAPLASKEQRRAMVVSALAPIPAFTFLDIEIQQSSPCFTIDTMRTLLQKSDYSSYHYHLILGEDQLATFHFWREYEELVHLAPPLIGCRSSLPPSFPKELSKEVVSLLKKGMTKTSILEISSTTIRERVSKGLYCGHLLPAKVEEYIHQNQLYTG